LNIEKLAKAKAARKLLVNFTVNPIMIGPTNPQGSQPSMISARPDAAETPVRNSEGIDQNGPLEPAATTSDKNMRVAKDELAIEQSTSRR